MLEEEIRFAEAGVGVDSPRRSVGEHGAGG